MWILSAHYFSLGTEILAASYNGQTDEVIKALLERIISRFGVQQVFHSDSGSQFNSHKLRRYLEDTAITQRFTAPSTPQENPAERTNRTADDDDSPIRE